MRYLGFVVDRGIIMKNQEFTIKSERYVYFGGEIVNNELHLISEVYGEDWDSEQHIDFSRKDTAKIFPKMTLEEFKKAINIVNMLRDKKNG